MDKEEIIDYLEKIIYRIKSYPGKQLSFELLFEVLDCLSNLIALCQKELLIMSKQFKNIDILKFLKS
ncbi:MAG: hypothetical protein K9L17_06470 [Clostridiales bacterium]|nr:hypothetical protein [Clostridiales bacterium]MCF8022316.1 hypothetical protein [Clostridiales bacterium]